MQGGIDQSLETKMVISGYTFGLPQKPSKNGGAKEDRTPDLVNAIHALYQLSYGPNRGGIM